MCPIFPSFPREMGHVRLAPVWGYNSGFESTTRARRDPPPRSLCLALVRKILSLYALLFHALFALFLAALAVVALVSDAESFWFEILPWSGKTLARWLLGLGAAGVLLVTLAAKGRLRGLFFLWSLIVLALVVRGFFFSSYAFTPGTDQLRNALLVIAGALVAAIGARLGARTKRPERLV